MISPRPCTFGSLFAPGLPNPIMLSDDEITKNEMRVDKLLFATTELLVGSFVAKIGYTPAARLTFTCFNSSAWSSTSATSSITSAIGFIKSLALACLL